MKTMPTARTAPSPKARRQPTCWSTTRGSSSTMLAPLPRMAPNQYVPLIARSTQPRRTAGINSSIVELIALYSPPMPSPVRKRKARKLHTFHDVAVSNVATRYHASVIKKSFLRPKRSVR